MNDNNGNIRNYNTADIRRYVQGEMSDAEMHAIEKAALEDEFLADAIDGFASGMTEHGSEAINDSSTQLEKALHDRLSQNKKKQIAPVIRMKWWQAAAAAAIIITAGVLGYRSYTDRSQVMLTVNEPLVDKSREVPATEDTNKEAKERGITDESKVDSNDFESAKERTATTVQSNKAAGTPKGAPALPQLETEAKAEDIRSLTMDRTAGTDNQRVTRIPTDSLPNAAPVSLDKALADRAAGVEIQSPKQKSVSPKAITHSNAASSHINDSNKSFLNYYKGQIVTTDNKPISNAVLKLVDQSTSYTTDNNGKFVIPSNDSVLDVNVTMVGSEPTRFRLQNNIASNHLILPDSKSELSEVVVIGYGTQKKKDLTGSVSVPGRQAEPVGGWLAFEQYLEKNKDSTLLLNGTAETQVSFEVNEKSQLSKFRFIKSISSQHNNEIIRLIKAGPQWKLLKSKKATVTITLRF